MVTGLSDDDRRKAEELRLSIVEMLEMYADPRRPPLNARQQEIVRLGTIVLDDIRRTLRHV